MPIIDARFPSAGLSRHYDYQTQTPFTTPACNNVRPFDTILERERGGSRPGLAKAFALQVGTGGARLPRLISEVSYTDASHLRKTQLVVSANGTLYREATDGVLTALTTSEVLTSKYQLQSAEYGGKLFIADWDEDPTVAAADRAPKIYDPLADTLTDWATETRDAEEGETPPVYRGTVPTGCSIIALFHDRMFLGGAIADPQQWYMSRLGNPYDFEYGYPEIDPSQAISGTTSTTGRLGEPLNAAASFTNNCMVLGCTRSMWVLQGDPVSGGQFSNVSSTIGCVDRCAWCYAPAQASGGPRIFVFLSHDGIYGLPVTCSADIAPQSLSRAALPQELRNIDRSTHTVSMSYDVRDRGIHIFVTSITAGTSSHWYFDWQTRGLFAISLQTDHDPFFAFERYKPTSSYSQSMLGCRDGYIRHFRHDEADDDGSAITSYVDLGPFFAGEKGALAGVLAEISATLASGSGEVTYQVRSASAPEAAFNASVKYTGTFRRDGHNPNQYPRVRGSDFYLRLSSTDSWALERLRIRFQPHTLNRY